MSADRILDRGAHPARGSMVFDAVIRILRGVLVMFGLGLATQVAATEGEVRVATLNVMNYLCMDRRIDGRFAPGYPKPEAEKAAVREVIRTVQADVLCLQEIGPRPFFDELRQDLALEGLDYPHAAWLEAADPLRHVAVLSRIPFREVVEHADLPFKYLGREERVKRGLLEVSFDSPGGVWTVFVLHLKSPLTVDAADPLSEIRRSSEARVIRDLILTRTNQAKTAYLIAGDVNAAPDSKTLRTLKARGRRVISVPLTSTDSRGETWTHRQKARDRYERIDYLLVSPALMPRVAGGVGHIHDGDSALLGTDHRLVWLDLDVIQTIPPQTKTPTGDEPAGVSEKG